MLGKLRPRVQLGFINKKMVSFYCYSNGEVRWIKDGKEMKYTYHILTNNINFQEYQLKIRLISFSQSGIYSCLGTLNNGEGFNANSRLYVRSKDISKN